MRRFQDISEFSHSLDPFRTSVEGRRRPTGGNGSAARQIRRAAGLYFKREWYAVADAALAELDVVRYWDLA
jgi:hypothetical protein